MKKIAVVLLLLIAAASFAQDGGKKKGKLKNITPEEMATLQTKKATLALDLTEKQQEQIKTLLLEKAKIRNSAMSSQKARKDDQGEAVTVDERYAREAERLDYQIAERAELQKILSAEQMAKWEEMQKRRGHPGKRKGHNKSKE